MSREEVRDRLAAKEKPASLSREAWERKLALVKEHKFENLDELRDSITRKGIDDRCALCVFNYTCTNCSLYKIDGTCITHKISTYTKMSRAKTHKDLVSGIELLIEKLKEAEKLESQTDFF